MRDYIGLVTALLGLIAGLMLLAGSAVNLSDQPQQLRFFLVIAYIVFGVGSILFAFKSKEIPQTWRWASLVVLFVTSIPFFIWVGTWANIGQQQPQPEPSLPLEIAHAFDFEEKEDVTDISPWYSVPAVKAHELVISDTPEFSHSGRKSLRQELNINRSLEEDPDEYGGIGVDGHVYPRLTSQTINAAVAWVLVPKSVQAQDSRMAAHIIAYTVDQNGNPLYLYGEDVRLVPGDWTSVFWGGTYTVEVDAQSLPTEVVSETLTFNSVDSKLGELFLSVWSDKPYSDYIYIDDIVMYTAP